MRDTHTQKNHLKIGKIIEQKQNNWITIDDFTLEITRNSLTLEYEPIDEAK